MLSAIVFLFNAGAFVLFNLVGVVFSNGKAPHDARLNMATSLARQGKTEQASRELTRLVEQDPDNAVARTNLGLVLLQLGKVEQARVQLEAALRSDPGLEPARQALDSIRP